LQRRIEWTPLARRDIRAAFQYVAERNRAAADGILERIRRSIARLIDFPESGRTGRLEGTREIVVPGLPYVAICRVRDGNVEILRVLHTSRRWPPEP